LEVPYDNGNRVCGWRLRLCGVNDGLRRAIFSLKISAVKPAAWQLKQESQNSFCRKHVIARRAASAGQRRVQAELSANKQTSRVSLVL
jgi:hypothetical protein